MKNITHSSINHNKELSIKVKGLLKGNKAMPQN